MKLFGGHNNGNVVVVAVVCILKLEPKALLDEARKMLHFGDKLRLERLPERWFE
eukprot:CAMPEP_0119332230 /NCGR_PEP_ID=MMETSP1333-20130426/82315_1 /TAXON_ID=418940 /ORGANISM="Scyphosphaera apsteinii, Strain RCC1455" /LENGTH=53 /DNA_ID=CAMNT_0007342013 /DNA_START=414 /DNA_END=575 /DNA_ORIENTATION=+